MLNLDYSNVEDTKKQIISFIRNSSSIDRYNFLKSLKTDNEFKIFYKFITKHRLSSLFKCNRSNNLISLYTNNNYLNYLYVMFMSNSYETDFNSFFNYYNLNKEERQYITNLFYIDIDYKEHTSPHQIINNIIDEYYTVDDIYSYIDLKFRKRSNCPLYNRIKYALNFLKKNSNTIKSNDKDINKKIDLIILNRFYPTKTSGEPVIGFAKSSITSPTRTTGLPLTKTSGEPVIETESCVSPVIKSVCLSHLSPTRRTALPLINTSSEPDIDFLGGYASGCPEQTSPTRTAGFDINELFIAS